MSCPRKSRDLFVIHKPKMFFQRNSCDSLVTPSHQSNSSVAGYTHHKFQVHNEKREKFIFLLNLVSKLRVVYKWQISNFLVSTHFYESFIH